VIAFPKNTLGASPLDESPARVEDEQLKELGLKVSP
jgi:aspartyl-tRNA synthetase